MAPALPGWPRSADPVWFEVEGATHRIESSADLLAGLYLLPAMAIGRDLVLPSPLDPQLARQLPEAISLLAHWFEPLQAIQLRSPRQRSIDQPDGSSQAPPAERETACFFTGGVDSFRTLQRHLDRTDALVFVYGLDVGESNPNLWHQTGEMMRAVADETGKRLVVVRTNLRQHLDRVIPWELSHGTALAAVARLLQGDFKEVLLASSYADHQLIPWGSHPALDKQWSTERQKFTHDGSDEERWQKVGHLLEWPLAREWLRVCTWNTDDTYNCGQCSKCLRTMTALNLLDADGSVSTLPRHLDLEKLRGLTIRSVAELPFLEELAVNARAAGERKKELASILDQLLQQPDLPVGHAPTHLARLPLKPLKVSLAAFEEAEDRWTWIVELLWGGQRNELRVQLVAPGFPPTRGDIADAALVFLTPLAMHLGVPMEFADDLPVDPELVDRIEYHQHLLARMPKRHALRESPLRVQRREQPDDNPIRAARIGAAFSGGVDANVLAAACAPRPGVLIYVHGLDTERQTEARKTKAEQRVREAAACHGIPVALIDTNLRDLMCRSFGMHWGFCCRAGIHGGSHLLAAHINTSSIASDVPPSRQADKTYRNCIGDAGVFNDNHPLLFAMNSSSRVRQEYWEDGRTRPQRIQFIAGVPGCLSRIWVCQEEAKGLYRGERPNCGSCEKCLRTMFSMLAVLEGPDFFAFDAELEISAVERITHLNETVRLEWQGIRHRLAHRYGEAAETVRVLDDLLERTGPTRPQRLAWARDPELMEKLRAHPGYAKWLKHHGQPLAEEVFGDKPAKRVLQWLGDSRGLKAFRGTALHHLARKHPEKLERWVRKARIKRLLGLDP